MRYNFDKDTCFLVFKKQLPINYCAKLDEVKDLAVAFDAAGNDFELDWDTLVRRAERFTKGARLAPADNGRQIIGLEDKIPE
jgi:hypothetical protein